MDLRRDPRKIALIPRFMGALKHNDVHEARALIQAGMDVDMSFSYGFNEKPAICVCIEERSTEVAKLLINEGCSVNRATGKGLTPLHLAVENNYYELVQLLIRNRANVNARDFQIRTPLHIVCRAGYYDSLFDLLNAGADINAVDCDWRTPLLHACSHGHNQMAVSLIERGADIHHQDRIRNSALAYALVANPTVHLVKVLIEHGAEVNPRQGFAPVLKYLTSLRGTEALNSNVSTDILRILIDAGCKLNVEMPSGLNALHIASYLGYVPLVKMLLNVGCPMKPDKLGKTPLFYACFYNCVEVVKLLVAAGVNWQEELWLRNETLKSQCSEDLISYCVQREKIFPTLCELSRTVLRRILAPEIDRFANALHCPPLLKDYIKLEHY